MSRQTYAEDEDQFVKELTNHGGSVGNKALLETLDWGEDRYSHIRKRLIDKGLVKVRRGGPGGTVYLLGQKSDGPEGEGAKQGAVENKKSKVEGDYPSHVYEKLEKGLSESITTGFVPAVLGDTSVTSMDILTFMHRYDDGVYYVPDYQRDSSQWDIARRSLFIESLINNITVPPLFVFPKAPNENEIVDGQQRVATIRDFLDNNLTLVSDDEAEYRDNVAPIIQGKKFNELPPALQNQIEKYLLTIVKLPAELDLERSPSRLNRGDFPNRSHSDS
jgi:hypothetical protein